MTSKTPISVLKRYGEALLDLLFPRECTSCGAVLRVDEEYLCLKCEADFPLTYTWRQRHNPMADRFNALIQKELDAAADESSIENAEVHAEEFAEEYAGGRPEGGAECSWAASGNYKAEDSGAFRGAIRLCLLPVLLPRHSGYSQIYPAA